jgi:hypothetical protein
MSINSTNVLPYFRLNGFQQEVVDRRKGVREDEFRPCQDTELVADGVEIVYAAGSSCVRGLIYPASPNAELIRESR